MMILKVLPKTNLAGGEDEKRQLLVGWVNNQTLPASDMLIIQSCHEGLLNFKKRKEIQVDWRILQSSFCPEDESSPFNGWFLEGDV